MKRESTDLLNKIQYAIGEITAHILYTIEVAIDTDEPASWGPLGACLGPLGASWAPFEPEGSTFQFWVPLLSPPWARLGASWSSWVFLGVERVLFWVGGPTLKKTGANPEKNPRRFFFRGGSFFFWLGVFFWGGRFF